MNSAIFCLLSDHTHRQQHEIYHRLQDLQFKQTLWCHSVLWPV